MVFQISYMKNFLDTFTSTDPYKLKLSWIKLASYPFMKYTCIRKVWPKHQVKTSTRIPCITHAIKLKMKERKQLYDIGLWKHRHINLGRLILSWETNNSEISEVHTNYQTQILKITLALFQKILEVHKKHMKRSRWNSSLDNRWGYK